MQIRATVERVLTLRRCAELSGIAHRWRRPEDWRHARLLKPKLWLLTGTALSTDILKLNGDGELLWARGLANVFSKSSGLGVDESGNVVMTGRFGAAVDLESALCQACSAA